jgi:hypothetical protein
VSSDIKPNLMIGGLCSARAGCNPGPPRKTEQLLDSLQITGTLMITFPFLILISNQVISKS